jgi:hypothetical protein
MSDFESWLAALERQIDCVPDLHGDRAGVKAELRRLAAYARGRAGAPPPASEPKPEPAPEPAAPNATEPEPAPASSEPADGQPQ